jgi:hypothetical protein
MMTFETPTEILDNQAESKPALPAFTIMPNLPKPGETINVDIHLPDAQSRGKVPRSLVLEDADEGRVWATVPTASAGGTVGGLRVRLKLSDDLAPGLYRLVLLGSENAEIARENIIIIDWQMEKQIVAAEAGLEYTLKAAEAKKSGAVPQAIGLLERSAREYQRAGSLQCAGFAYADAAALERGRERGTERFETLGWKAVELLLCAGDADGAASVVRLLSDSSGSVIATAARFIEVAGAALPLIASETADEVELERMQAMILQVANKALPQPQHYVETEDILDQIESSKRNLYILNEDELLSLATSAIETYTPKVLLNSPRGWGLNSMIFSDALSKSGKLAIV